MFAQHYRRLIERRGVATCLMHNFFHILGFSLCLFCVMYLLETIIDTYLYRYYIFFSIFASMAFSFNFFSACMRYVNNLPLFFLSVATWVFYNSVPFLVGALQIFLPNVIEFDFNYYTTDTYSVATYTIPYLSFVYLIITIAMLMERHKK